MNKSVRPILMLTLAAFLSGGWPANASDPVGVYAIVDRVVFEPSEGEPQRIQIWGVFAFAKGRGDTYEPAQRGYLYYTLAEGKESVCRKEWADLKAVAGKGEGIGFGGRYLKNGELRKKGAPQRNPDSYPIMMGVVKMGSKHDQHRILQDLKRVS